MSDQDVDYFRRREHQERERAAHADNSIARHLHQEMANRYSAKAADAAVVVPLQLA